MTDREQAEAFEHDLDALINRYRAEFSLTVMAAVAILEVKKFQILQEHYDASDDEE